MSLLHKHLQRRSSIPSTDLATDILAVSKSIVKIYTSFSAPIFNQPWQLSTQSTSSSTGFIIQRDGVKYILTNAHALSHFTRVSVKKPAGRKYNAHVLCISDCNDLALLTVEDQTFWYNTPALPIGSLPNINTSLYVVGFPLSAEEISFSAGVVSRVAVTPYAHSGESYLSITTDAGLNPGNSGGPIVGLEDGVFKALGVAFETITTANAVSFAIAPSVIENFLDGFISHNLGTPSLNIMTQSMESQVMRDALFIPPLSGLIEYMYNIDTTKSSTPHVLPRLAPACPTDETILSPKIIVAGDPEAMDLPAPHADSTNVFQHDSQPHIKIHNSPDSPRIHKALSTTSTSSSGSLGSPTSSPNQRQHHRRDPDSNSKFKSSIRNRRNSLCSSQVYRAQHSVIGSDGDFDYVIFHPIEPIGCNASPSQRPTPTSPHTPVYRIQRPAQGPRIEIPDQLRDYLTADQVNDTAIGIRVAAVTPFTATATVLKPGDVILAIDHVPIANDQTILLRGTERVKFVHLINNKHIGDTIHITFSRGFNIFQHKIEIEQKQYIAKWSQYQTPQWLAALGLIFVPLTSNLMASEYGSGWDSVAPIPLLQQLFSGTLRRMFPDEECVVLTQILAHTCNDGYDQSMRRVTHINGVQVINLKHLATLINAAVKRYEDSKATSDVTPTPSQTHFDPGNGAGESSPYIQTNSSPSTTSKSNAPTSSSPMSAVPENRSAIKSSSRQRVCITAQNGESFTTSESDDESVSSPELAEKMNPDALKNVVVDGMRPPASPQMGSLVDITPQQSTEGALRSPPRKTSNNPPFFASPPISDASTNTPQSKPSAQEIVCSTVAALANLTNHESTFRHQDAYAQYSRLFHDEANIKFLNITLENAQTIILSLENGQANQLEILELHQLPIPGCSDQVLPMYSFDVSIGAPDGTRVLSPLSTNPNSSATPVQNHHHHHQVRSLAQPSPFPAHLSPYRTSGKWNSVHSYEDRTYKPFVSKNDKTKTEAKDEDQKDDNAETDDSEFGAFFSTSSPPQLPPTINMIAASHPKIGNTHRNTASPVSNRNPGAGNASTTLKSFAMKQTQPEPLPSPSLQSLQVQPFPFQKGNRGLTHPVVHSSPVQQNILTAQARANDTTNPNKQCPVQGFVNQSHVNYHLNNQAQRKKKL